MNNRTIILVLSAVLIAAVVSGCVQEVSEIETTGEVPEPGGTPQPGVSPQAPTPEAIPPSGEPTVPFRQHLSFSNAPALNQTADITCTLVANGDIPNTFVRIMLPEGIVFVDSDGTWTGSLSNNKTVQFTATIKVVKTGNWTIRVFNAAGCVYVLSASEDTASVSELTLLEYKMLHHTPAKMPDDIKRGSATPPEGMIYPEEFIIYQDYIKTIGGKPIISDIGTVEATIISITRTEVCPDETDPFAPEPTECSIEPYPKDLGMVRIDKIINYAQHSEQTIEAPIEQPGKEEPSEGNTTVTSGYKGSESQPKPKPPIEYEPLHEGQEVQTLFILTVRPVKIRYVPINESEGGMESEQLTEDDTQQTGSHQVVPENKIFKPIHTDGDCFVFTTKIGRFPEIIENPLSGLEVGGTFRAEIRYDGSLVYVREYDVTGD